MRSANGSIGELLQVTRQILGDARKFLKEVDATTTPKPGERIERVPQDHGGRGASRGPADEGAHFRRRDEIAGQDR